MDLGRTQRAVIELLSGQLTQGLLEHWLGLGHDAVGLEGAADAEASEDQIGVRDLVEDADVHINEEAVRGLNVGGLADGRFPRGLLPCAGEVQHLQVLGKQIHFLEIERFEHQMKAGVVHLLVHAPRSQHRHPHGLDAVLVRPHIGDAEEDQELQADHHGENRKDDFTEEVAAHEPAERGLRPPLRAEFFQVDNVVWRLKRAIVRHGAPPPCDCAILARAGEGGPKAQQKGRKGERAKRVGEFLSVARFVLLLTHYSSLLTF